MEAVVTTDWHLDLLNNIFHNNPEVGIKLQIKDIEKPFEYALDNGIKTVIVAGDIGQHCELSSTAKFHLLTLLMKYDGLLNIHMIPGNHDYNRIGVHSLKLVELLCIKNKFQTVSLYTEPTKVKIGGVLFNFLPYPHTNGKVGAINIAHLEPTGALRDNGKKVHNGQNLAEDTYWVIGHLHTYQQLNNAVLPGTLFQTKFGDRLPKGFIHLTAKPERKPRHRFIEIQPSFQYTTVEIVRPEDWALISRQETNFHRVYVQNSLIVPDEIYQYPNVIQISGKIEEQEQETDTKTEALKLVEDDDEVLGLYLRETYNLNKRQVKRSLKLIAEARAQL